jgi:hypothetical protein
MDVWTGQAAFLVHDLSWSNPSNWSQGKPQAGQTLVFPGGKNTVISGGVLVTWSPAGPTTNDLAGMAFDSIEIDSAGYAISGAALDLTGPTPLATSYTSGISSLNLDLNLGGAGINVAGGGELDIGGAMGGTAGLTLSGGGKLQLGSYSNAIGVSSVQEGTLIVTNTFTAAIDSSGHFFTLDSSGASSSVVLGPSSELTVSMAAPSLPMGSTFQLITGHVSGTFNGLPEGARLSSNGTVFSISQ